MFHGYLHSKVSAEDWGIPRVYTLSPPPLTMLTIDCFLTAQQTRDIEPMLVQCWPAVYDIGPTINQHGSGYTASRCLRQCSG